MIYLRSLVFNVALYSLTTLMCLLTLPVLLLPLAAMMAVVHLWLNQVNWIERHLAGITYNVVGLENVPEGPCIIAAKHQSAWETFKLHVLFDNPAIVLKKELLNIPVWGWFLRRAGMIPIDRAAGSKAVSAMLQAGHKAVDAGRKIVIFPQGTRVVPGAWKPYKTGVAALYQELNIPVIPLALNSGLLWPKGSFIKKPGIITLEFLPAIEPGLPRDELMATLKTKLETAGDRLAGLTKPAPISTTKGMNDA